MVQRYWAMYPLGTKVNRAFVSRQLEHEIEWLKGVISVSFTEILDCFFYPVLDMPRKDSIQRFMDKCPSRMRAARMSFFAFIGIPYIFAWIVYEILKYTGTMLLLFALAMLAVLGFTIFFLMMNSGFFVWAIAYRVPVYEWMYPRIRAWMLRHNSKIYSPIPSHDSSGDAARVRVLRIHPGRGRECMRCSLKPATIFDTEYEALSYAWGTSLVPHKIIVDGMPFYVTSNLYSALHELRYSDRDRIVWIDAICINQSDNAEKSTQVQMMRQIYSRAMETTVWLGQGSQATRMVFDTVRRISDTIEEGRAEAWKIELRSRSWRNIRRGIYSLFSNEWWVRAWIVQEVVVSPNVVVRKGSDKISWEQLHAVLDMTEFWQEFPLEGVSFTRRVQELRSRTHWAKEPPSIISLAYRFRTQAASFGSDKVFSLLGLLDPSKSLDLVPNYSMPPEEVFLHFTVACLRSGGNLLAVILAVGAELQGTSWCRDWALAMDGMDPIEWFSINEPVHRFYSAAGDHPVIFDADIPNRILHVQGSEVDTIADIGVPNRSGAENIKDWMLANCISSWEYVAAGNRKDTFLTEEKRKEFNRTIIADRVEDACDLDWRVKLYGDHPEAPEKTTDTRYFHTADEACGNRNFFVTKSGRFGLGPQNLKRGDTVCILLGSHVPIILRKLKNTPLHVREQHALVQHAGPLKSKEFFEVIGESYVDGYMYYTGDIKQDVETGQLSLRWFNLV